MTRTTRLATPGPKSNRSPTYCPMRGVVLRDDTNQLVRDVDDLFRRLAAEMLHDRLAPERHPADFVLGGARSDLQTIPHLAVHLHDHCDQLVACKLGRSEEHTSELQSRLHLVCRLLLEKKKKK